MIVSTTPSLEGYKSVRYVGVLNGFPIRRSTVFIVLFVTVQLLFRVPLHAGVPV